MLKTMVSSFFLTLSVFLVIYETTTYGRAHVIILFTVSSLMAFYAALSTAKDYGYNRGRGMLKDEKELLENNEIYQTIGAVKMGIYDGSVVILRLRDGELRGCRMDEIPPAKTFIVRKDGNNGINKYEYPPESLKGKIIDIKA